MIYDSMKYADQYKGISPEMDKALEILKTTDFASLEPGPYHREDGIWFNVMTPEVHPWEETSWECHRAYIDIQHVLVEGEKIGVCPLEDLTWTEFNEKDDYALSSEDSKNTVCLSMDPDKFAIFFPSDAHRPTVAADGVKQVKKVCIKVPV